MVTALGRLQVALDAVDRQIRGQVEEHYDALMAQMDNVNDLEGSLTVARAGLETLQLALNRCAPAGAAKRGRSTGRLTDLFGAHGNCVRAHMRTRTAFVTRSRHRTRQSLSTRGSSNGSRAPHTCCASSYATSSSSSASAPPSDPAPSTWPTRRADFTKSVRAAFALFRAVHRHPARSHSAKTPDVRAAARGAWHRSAAARECPATVADGRRGPRRP